MKRCIFQEVPSWFCANVNITPEKGAVSGISERAQAIIERLTGPDGKSGLDRRVIERAMAEYLAGLSLRRRPVRWFPDAISAHAHVVMKAAAAGRASDQAVAWDLALNAVRESVYDAAVQKVDQLEDYPSGDDEGRSAIDVLRSTAWARAMDVARRTSEAAAMTMARDHAEAAMCTAASDAIEPSEIADFMKFDRYRKEVRWSLRHILASAGLHRFFSIPVNACPRNVFMPLAEAVEAGLFCFWVAPDEIICVPQPLLSIMDGRLHSESGPAIVWSASERYWFWRGVQVPGWLVDHPARITPELIRSERNQEVRRCMMERFGTRRFREEAGAELLSEDKHGKLWRCDFGDDDPYLFVEVRDASPQADGSHRTYYLSVPPGMRTAHEAVAWTYGLTPRQYDPVERT